MVRGGKPYPPASVEDMEILPGVAEALVSLRDAGFLLIGATNQPDVARGTQKREVVEMINDRLMATLPLRAIMVSYDDGESPRRKPNPGLLLEASTRYGVDLTSSFMVGDRWKDVEAGRRAGCRTIFIDRGYHEPRPEPPADFTTDGLPAATAWILEKTRTGGTSHA